jgi:hypothetical protein
MDERRTDEQGDTPPQDMPTQAWTPPATPSDVPGASDAEPPGVPAPQPQPATTSPADWQQPATASTPPPASWQQSSPAAPPVDWQPPTTAPEAPAYQPPPATTGAPPPAPTWQQTAPPAAAAATGWQQPQSQWVQPAVYAPAQGGATGLAKVGSIVLILFGLLWTFFGVVIVAAVNTFIDLLRPQLDQISENAAETAANVAIGIGIVVLVIGVLHLMSGIFSWRAAGWARFVGIALGLVFGLLFLAGLLGPRATQPIAEGAANPFATTAVAAIGYLYVAIVFLFRYRKTAGT